MVALRMHYPFQASTLASFRQEVSGDEVMNSPVAADDSTMAADEMPVDLDCSDVGAYSGRFGLGNLGTFGESGVRPFRRIIAAQSIFRREVFFDETYLVDSDG